MILIATKLISAKLLLFDNNERMLMMLESGIKLLTYSVVGLILLQAGPQHDIDLVAPTLLFLA